MNLTDLHLSQRQEKLSLIADKDLAANLAIANDPLWHEIEDLNVDERFKVTLAKQLLESSNPAPGERIVVVASPKCREIVEYFLKFAQEKRVLVDLDLVDPYHRMLMINHATDEQLKTLAAYDVAKYENISRLVKISANQDPQIAAQIDTRKWDLYQQYRRPLRTRIMNGDLFYTLTVLPTRIDARLDDMPYEEYLRLFFELCDQPWEQIQTAQAKLIDKFNSGSSLRITNDDGTDILLDITGQTFANSVVAKNIPGSEIFSSPIRTGVNGRIVAKGKFQEGSSGLIEDITMEFVDGRIVDFDAKSGYDYLADIITADDTNGEGARYLGEIGIGTNPHLRRHVINGLLVEKVGGSFHVALGNAYQYSDYCGTPVKVDNGNRSATGIHWDITTMLRGVGGRMIIDGELIQLNGDWLDADLKVLNEGWAAIPSVERPFWYV